MYVVDVVVIFNNLRCIILFVILLIRFCLCCCFICIEDNYIWLFWRCCMYYGMVGECMILFIFIFCFVDVYIFYFKIWKRYVMWFSVLWFIYVWISFGLLLLVIMRFGVCVGYFFSVNSFIYFLDFGMWIL